MASGEPTTAREAPTTTRSAILDAARSLFESSGISQTNMDDIAAAANLSRKTVYYHFKKKRHLAEEILGERAEQILDQVRAEIRFQPATLELIVTACMRVIELSANDNLTRHLVATDQGRALARDLLSERLLPVRRAFWFPILQAAKDNGELRDNLDLDFTLSWLLFLTMSLISLGPDYGLEGDQLRAALENFFVHGIANPAD